MTSNPKLLVSCCYLGMFVQAMVINLTPLLFIPLREQFDLTFEQIGRLVLLNFTMQMGVDLVCTAVADRMPVKFLTVLANLLATLGLILFALGPDWFADPYAGLVLGTLVFSAGCGLLEVLLSPIINAIPSASKSGAMALLHAFYPIGKVVVIVVTGLVLHFGGAAGWWLIALAWAIVPLINCLGFLFVRIPPLRPEGAHAPLRALFRGPAYWLLLGAIALAGATEVTIAQWASAYIEKGLGFTKFVADLVGFALFGVGMIIGRVWFGLRGEQGDLHRTMTIGAALSAVCCLAMTLLPIPWLALVACATSGLFVSMLWPGSLSLASHRFPLAGAAMFALMAAAGDAGAAFMPWAVGMLADLFARTLSLPGFSPEQIGLRGALLVAAAAPILLLAVLAAFHRLPPTKPLSSPPAT